MLVSADWFRAMKRSRTITFRNVAYARVQYDSCPLMACKFKKIIPAEQITVEWYQQPKETGQTTLNMSDKELLAFVVIQTIYYRGNL